MPKGPQGPKRSVDVVGSAIMAARLATGEINDDMQEPFNPFRSGIAGASACADAITKEERSPEAKQAAASRLN